MADFESALDRSLQSYDPSLVLKDKQLEALRHLYDGKDVLAVLPTGYGKSVIFHLLPTLLSHSGGGIVIVVSPLNAIIMDQISKLAKNNIKACCFTVDRRVTTLESVMGEEDGDNCDESPALLLNDSSDLTALCAGEYQLVFAHPEAVLSEAGQDIMGSAVYQARVVAVAVDEAHCIKEWYVYVLK